MATMAVAVDTTDKIMDVVTKSDADTVAEVDNKVVTVMAVSSTITKHTIRDMKNQNIQGKNNQGYHYDNSFYNSQGRGKQQGPPAWQQQVHGVSNSSGQG